MEELRQMKPTEVKPTSNYKDKYVHLIGQDAAVEAAKKTGTNKTYGFGMTAFKFTIFRNEKIYQFLLLFIRSSE